MFNTKISQQALDSIEEFPDRWNQRVYHGYISILDSPECATSHCWLGWCDVHLGNYDNDPESLVYGKTREAMGLTKEDLLIFTSMSNSLSRLKLLHKYFTERNTNPEAVFGVDGFDEEGRPFSIHRNIDVF